MGAFTMGSRKLLLLVMILGVCAIWVGTVAHLWFGKDPDRGRNPCLGYLDQSYGKGTPAGARNRQGRCAALSCRRGARDATGATGIGGPSSYFDVKSGRTSRTWQGSAAGMEGMHMVPDTGIMALRSPYATTMWDYINRGMPLSKEGTLKPDEVYALTAFLLYKNDVIKEDEVLDAQSLPKVKMPNRDGFAQPSGVEAWGAEAAWLPLNPSEWERRFPYLASSVQGSSLRDHAEHYLPVSRGIPDNNLFGMS